MTPCQRGGSGCLLVDRPRARAASSWTTPQGLFDLARLKREQARNYAAACSSEEELATILRPLDALGWVVLEDRRWPRSKRANVDFILVGPGGVVVVDAKSWGELEIRDGSLYRGDACEDEQTAKLSALIDSLADGIAHTGLTCTSISAAMVFTGRALNVAAAVR